MTSLAQDAAVKADVQCQCPCRVLILGDGNLSFSASMMSILSKSADFVSRYRILVTTYDTLEELLLKYPDCAGILRQLERYSSNVTVKHSVDATTDLRPLLTEFGVQDFTDIIFNFPHLAVENAVLHSSLLGHFLHHARAVLPTEPAAPCPHAAADVTPEVDRAAHGTIYIALANAQADRWRLPAMVERNQLELHQALPFDVHRDLAGYQIKRHHNASSFVRRVGDCSCFCIKRWGSSRAPSAL